MTQPEFSRFYRLDQFDCKPATVELAATPAERAALADRFDLIALDSLTVTARIKRIDKGRIAEVRGHLTADVAQRCIVTLEPAPAHVEESFHIRFVPSEMIGPENPDEIIVDMEEDDVEPLENDGFDLGEAVAQHLSLALDPYPRKADAELPETADEPEPEPVRPNPFTILKHKG